MCNKQAEVRITVQQLEMLLENWGLFATTGTWGPKVAVECGSADRLWNDHSSRYVWDEGGRPSRRAVADDAMGMMVERLLEGMPGDWRRVLLRWYGLGHRDLCAHSRALLVSGKAFVLEKLEEKSYA